MSLRADAATPHPELVTLRRKPEIGLVPPRTQETVLSALDRPDLESTLGENLTAVLRRSGGPGGTVLLRGDTAALPVTASSGEEFSSTSDDATHAGGHDLRTPGLAGAVRPLADRPDKLAHGAILLAEPACRRLALLAA
ncbi:hypothetical protein [Amycolatopsis benzoatilytica]|uniref:hypothetical protein n=1 Tax=Amycolatopsis benzoatilytica TaxID=346045 RepID=UPI000369A5A4|nr:hypothetical protein [Amycolatopsis benzoatilytica]